MKKCSSCQEIKSLEDFHNSKASKDGKGYRCKPCDYLARKAHRLRNLDRTRIKDRKRNLRSKYNLSLEEYEEILKRQGGVCAICSTDNPVGEGNTHNRVEFAFAVDHCHDSGRIRGLLCNPCNRGLGLFKDNPQFVLQAFKYICTK